jgi:CRP-like cAMP-binding protein
LLAQLPAAVFAVLQPHLRPPDFAEGAVLWEAGEAADQIYFPRSGVISLRVPTRSGDGIEVGSVGRQAAAGFGHAGSSVASIARAVTQQAGRFACVSTHRFAELAREHPELVDLERRCNGWLLLQAQQIAACNATHSADGRVSRWLLRACDAAGTETIHATQETIAEALGLRRTTATLIAQHLQQTGAISYTRGKITIRSRAALEAAACDCHAVFGPRNWPSGLVDPNASPPA